MTPDDVLKITTLYHLNKKLLYNHEIWQEE